MSLKDLYTAVQDQAQKGKLNLWELADKCGGISELVTHLPFVQELSLYSGINITSISDGKFSVSGTGKSALLDGITASVEFQGDGDAMLPALTLFSGKWSATTGGPLKSADLFAAFGLTSTLSNPPPWDLTLTAASFTDDLAAKKLDLEIDGQLSIAGTNLPFTLSDKSGGWTIDAKTAATQSIDFTSLVTELFGKFGLELPDHLPSFSLANLDFIYDFATEAAIFTGARTQPTPLQLGNQTHNVDTNLDLTVRTDAHGKRSFAGYLRGTITIGSAVFAGAYDFGDATVLQASWDGASGTLGYEDLAAAHGIEHALQVPGNMALPLTRATFEYEVSKGRFLLGADSKFGEAFFVASNANKTWDFAFGILIEPSQIPGFPNPTVLQLDDTMLVLSTVQDDNFVVPTLPGVHQPGMLGAPPPRTFPTIGTTKMPLKPGVSLVALLELGNGNSNVIVKNLRGAVGRSELLIQASVESLNQISFKSELDGSLAIAGAGKDKLVLSDVYVQLSESGAAVSATVGGSVLIPFNHVTLQATGAMSISETSMEAIFQLKAQQDGQPAAIPSPFGLAGVALDELDIEVGVDFEPPGVDLGIEGKFNIKGQQVDANDFTIVLDLEGEVPNPTYLSTHLQSLTIADAITALTGETLSHAPPVITAVQGQDISMYWSESAGIVLPDGTLSQGGFGFNGILSIGGFTAHGSLAVSAASGVSGDAEMSPIQLGKVFSLTGSGKGVTVKQVQRADGDWEAMAVPPQPGQKLTTRDHQIIAPGGATIAFNSQQSPFLDVSAKASLFNFINADVEIEIRDDGFNWKQTESIGSLAKIEFDCALSKSGFSCHDEFDFDLKGDIGPFKILGIDFGTLHLDIKFTADVTVSIDANGFSLEVSGSFEFEGDKLTMPTLTIQEDFQSFAQLPELILKQIEDEAETIFKKLFDEANQLLQGAEKEAEAIAADAEKEAKQIASDAEAAAAKVVATANQAYEAARQGVADAEAEVKNIDAAAAKVTADAVTIVEGIEGKAATEAKAIEGEAASVLSDAATAITTIDTALAHEISVIGDAATAVWNAAVLEATTIENAIAGEVQSILQWGTSVGDALVDAANAFKDAVATEVSKIADEIAEKLKEAAEWLEHQAEAAWHAVSKY